MTDKNVKPTPQMPDFESYQLKPEEVDSISAQKTQIMYLKGETLFKQGAFATHVLYIIDGLIKTYFQTGPNKLINIQICKAGDFLAFPSVFGSKVYNYSAQALKDTKVCMIDKEAMRDLIVKNSDFAITIASNNVSHEEHLLEILKTVSYKQMRGKLASALLYLSSDSFKDENVFQYLNRQDIAEFAALTPESAIRFLKEFEKEGLIKLDGKNISILELAELAAIS